MQVIDSSFGKLDYNVYMVIVLIPMLLLVSIRVSVTQKSFKEIIN